METTDLTIEILKDIRDEAKKTNAGIDELRGDLRDGLAGVNARIDETNSRLGAVRDRVVASEIRTATAIADLAGTVREMTGVLRAQSDLRPRVERCERDIEELKRRPG